MSTAIPPPYKAVVSTIARLSQQVVLLRIKMKPGEDAFVYEPGQFVQLELPNGVQRSYSLASADAHSKGLEFHIKLHAEGRFSEWLLDVLAGKHVAEQTIVVHGPYGQCVWEKSAGAEHVIMLATGTGIAPLKALIEQALSHDKHTPITLYWGGRTSADLYLAAYFDDLAQRYARFSWFPVLTDPAPEWPGLIGFVQEHAAKDFPDLTTAKVYACGAPSMVQQAESLLTASCGLSGDNFHADAFETAGVPFSLADVASVGLTVCHPNGKSHDIRAHEGDSLMQVLRSQALLLGVCGGNAACGSCRVEVDALWIAKLVQPERNERRLLSSLDSPQPRDRLACQIRLNRTLDGLVVYLSDRQI